MLYKKKDDDSLVILKEINLHDLNVGERQLAQNEVKVFKNLAFCIVGLSLHHIVSVDAVVDRRSLLLVMS